MTLLLPVALAVLLATPASAGRFLSFVESHASIVQRGTPLVSPDDAHVYVIGDDSLLAYARDGATGALSLVQALRDDAGGIDGLHSPTAFLGSPDGKHLYVVGGQDDGGRTISVFARDAVTGTLTLVSSAGHPTLAVATPLAISPDGSHVYAAAGSFDVATFARDPVTGALALVTTVSAGADELVVSPDGAHLYAVGSPRLTSFALDPVTGVPTQIDDMFFSNNLPRSLVISPDGAHVYVGKEDLLDGNHILRYDRNAVTGILALAESMSGAPGFDMAIDAAGDHVYAASSSGVTTVYERQPATGALTQIQTGVAAGRMSLSADGRNAYAQVTSGIAVLDRDLLDGTLTPQTVVAGEVGTPTGLDDARRGAVSADGRHVYVLGTDLSVWERDPTSGVLAFVELLTEAGSGIPGLHGADGITVTPDGGHVLVANADDQMLVVLRRDVPSGTLALVETQQHGVGGVTDLDDPRGSAVSADGIDVYVWGQGQAIARFQRDLGTGALTFVEGVPLPTSTGGTVRTGPALSPDGLRLYVPRSTGEAFVFTRDPASGALTFAELSVGGEGLAPSPDSRHVYAHGRFATPGAGEVQAFARTRGLALVGQVSVPGSSGQRQAIAVDPHGAYVWTANHEDDLGGDGFVTVLSRDPVRGGLFLLETVRDGNDGFTDLEGAVGLIASPDGRHLYVMARADDAVAVLAVTSCGTFHAPSGGSRLMVSRTGVDPDPTNDVLLVKGETLLRGADFAALDPVTNGSALRIERGDGSVVVDVTLPGGTFAGAGTAGWRRNASGTTWTFADRTPTPTGGVQKVVLRDAGKKTPRLVRVLVRGKKGSYPVSPGDEPVNVSVGLGLPGVCLQTGYPAPRCSFNGAATTVVCR